MLAELVKPRLFLLLLVWPASLSVAQNSQIDSGLLIEIFGNSGNEEWYKTEYLCVLKLLYKSIRTSSSGASPLCPPTTSTTSAPTTTTEASAASAASQCDQVLECARCAVAVPAQGDDEDDQDQSRTCPLYCWNFDYQWSDTLNTQGIGEMRRESVVKKTVQIYNLVLWL
jgi:hypothetical protein